MKEYTIINNSGDYIRKDFSSYDMITDMYSGIYFDMWKNSDYESNGCIYQRYGCKISEGDVVMDVGANIGMFTDRALSDGASKVYCFEPLKTAFRCLIENTNDNCELYKMGISDREGSEIIKTPINFENLGGSSIDHTYTYDPIYYSEKIYVNSIDNLYNRGIITHVDFLKIDCEGHELKVLQGMSDTTLEELEISKISIEYHNILGKKRMEHMINRFVLMGFKFFVLFGSNNIINLWK